MIRFECTETNYSGISGLEELSVSGVAKLAYYMSYQGSILQRQNYTCEFQENMVTVHMSNGKSSCIARIITDEADQYLINRIKRVVELSKMFDGTTTKAAIMISHACDVQISDVKIAQINAFCSRIAADTRIPVSAV